MSRVNHGNATDNVAFLEYVQTGLLRPVLWPWCSSGVSRRKLFDRSECKRTRTTTHRPIFRIFDAQRADLIGCRSLSTRIWDIEVDISFSARGIHMTRRHTLDCVSIFAALAFPQRLFPLAVAQVALRQAAMSAKALSVDSASACVGEPQVVMVWRVSVRPRWPTLFQKSVIFPGDR